MENEVAGYPEHVQNAPTTDMKRNVPTEGMLDERWPRFEEVYGQYIRDCIKEVDPAYEKITYNLMHRIESFMNEVMPRYEYRPKHERFRLFLRRLVHATVSYLKYGQGRMDDWLDEFKHVNEGIDADELEEAFDDLALGETLSSPNLTDDQILAFKDALAKTHIGEIASSGVEKEYEKAIAEFKKNRSVISLRNFLTSVGPLNAA